MRAFWLWMTILLIFCDSGVADVPRTEESGAPITFKRLAAERSRFAGKKVGLSARGSFPLFLGKTSACSHFFSGFQNRSGSKNRSGCQKACPNKNPPTEADGQDKPKTSQARKRADRAARADRHADQTDGSRPARDAADSTDGNGKAQAEHTAPTEPTKPARRNHDRATDQRAPTGDERKRNTDGDEENAEPQPGTSEARPEHTDDNGQAEPAQRTRGRPGTQSHAAKTQRQPNEKPDKANTPRETRNKNQSRARKREPRPQARSRRGASPSQRRHAKPRRRLRRQAEAHADRATRSRSSNGGEHVLGLRAVAIIGRPAAATWPGLSTARKSKNVTFADDVFCVSG